MNAKETAVVFIEFQNEFCKSGGKLHDIVKDEIERQGTVSNAVRLAKEAREKGCLIVHCGFVFDEEWVDEVCPSGILADAKEGGAFRPGDWGTEFIDELQPAEGDVVVRANYLAVTEKSAWGETDLNSFCLGTATRDSEDVSPPLAVAAVAERTITEPDATAGSDARSRIVVVGDSDFATNRFFGLLGNGDFERVGRPEV